MRQTLFLLSSLDLSVSLHGGVKVHLKVCGFSSQKFTVAFHRQLDGGFTTAPRQLDGSSTVAQW